MSYTQEKEFNCETPKEAIEHPDELGYECRFERSGLAKPKSEKSLKKKQDRFCSNYGISSFPAINVDIGKGAFSMKGEVCDVKTVQGHNHHGSIVQFQNQPARKIAKLDREYLMRNFPVSYFENVDILFKIIGKKKKFIKDTYKTEKKEKSKENVMSLDHKDSKRQSPELMPVQKPFYKEKIMKIKPGKVQIKEDHTVEEPMKRNTHKYKQIMTITQHHDAKQANRSMQKVFSQRKQRRQEQRQQSYQEKIRDITDNRNTLHSHAKSAEKFRIKHVQADTKGNSPDEFIKVITANPDSINNPKEKRVPVQKRNIKLNTQIAFHRQKRREANKSKTNLLEERKVQQLQPQKIEKEQVNNYRRSEEMSQRLYPDNRTLNSQHTDGNGVRPKEATRPVNDYFENDNQTEEDFDEDDKKTIKIGDDPQSQNEEKPVFSKPDTPKGKNPQLRIIKKEKSSERIKKNVPINMKKEEKKHQDIQVRPKNIKKVSRSPTSTNNYFKQQNKSRKNDIKVETKRSDQIKICENSQSPSQKIEVQPNRDLLEATIQPFQENKKEQDPKSESIPQKEELKQPTNNEFFAPTNMVNENKTFTHPSASEICPFPVTIGAQPATENLSFITPAVQPKKEPQIIQDKQIEPVEGFKGSLVEVENVRSSSCSQSEKQEDLKKTPRFNAGKDSNNAKRKRSTKRFDLIRSSEEATIVQYEPEDPVNPVNPLSTANHQEKVEKSPAQPIVKTEVAYENLHDTFSPANHTFVKKTAQNNHHQRQRTQQYRIPQRSQRTYSNIDSEQINNFYDEIVQLGVNETHQYRPKLGRKSNISEGKIKELIEYENLQKMMKQQQPIAKEQSHQQSQPNSMHSIDKAIMLYTQSDNLINNSCDPNLAFPHLSKKPSSKVSIFSSNSEAQKVPQSHVGKKKPTTIFQQQEEHLMNQTKPMVKQTQPMMDEQPKPTNLNSSLICIDLNQNANAPLAQPVILEPERSVFQEQNQILATTETKEYNEDYIVSVNKIGQNAPERQERLSEEHDKHETSSACMKIPSNNQKSKETSVIGSVSQISLLHLESQEEAQINKHLETLKKSPSRCSEVEQKSSSSESQAKENDIQETPQKQILKQQKYETNDFIATDKSFADEDIIKKRGSQVIVNSNGKVSDKIVENMKRSKSMKRLSLTCSQNMNKIQALKSAKSIHNMINQDQEEFQADLPAQSTYNNKKQEEGIIQQDVPAKIKPTFSEEIPEIAEKNFQGSNCKESNSAKQKEENRQSVMQVIEEKQPIKEIDQESVENYSVKGEQILNKSQEAGVGQVNHVEQCSQQQLEKVSNKKIEKQMQQPASIHDVTQKPDEVERNPSQKSLKVEKSPEESCPAQQNVVNVQQEKLQQLEPTKDKSQQKVEEAKAQPQTFAQKTPKSQISPTKDHTEKVQQINSQEQAKEKTAKQQKRSVKSNIKMHKMFEINIMNQLGAKNHVPQQNIQPVLQANQTLPENQVLPTKETQGSRKDSVKITSAAKEVNKQAEHNNSAKISSQQIPNKSEEKVQKNIQQEPEKQRPILQELKAQQESDKKIPTIVAVPPKVEEVPLAQQDLMEIKYQNQEEARQCSSTYLQELTSKIQSKMVVGQIEEQEVPKESEKIVPTTTNKPTQSKAQEHIEAEKCEPKQQKEEKLIENIQKLKQPICVLEEQYFFSDESQKSQQQSQQNIAALPLLQSNCSFPRSNTQRSSLQKVKLMLEDPSQIKLQEQQVQVSKKDFSTNTNDLLANYQEKIEGSTSSMSKLAEISKYIIDFDKEILLLKKSGEFSFNQQIWGMILKIFAFLDAKNAYIDRLTDQKSVWLFNCLQKQSKFHRYAFSNAQDTNQQNVKEALKQLVINLSRKVEIDQKNIKFFIETLTGMPVLLLKQTCYHKLDNLYRHSNIFGFTFGKGQVWRIVGTLLNKKNQQEKRLRLEKLSNNQIIEITWKKFLEEFKYSFIAGFSDKYHLRTFKVASNAGKNDEKPSFKLTINDESNSGNKVHCLMGITSHKELAKEVNGKMLVYGKTQSQKKGEQCYKYLGSGDIGLVSMKLKKGEYIIVLEIEQKTNISQLQILMGSESPEVTLKHEKA